MKLIEEILSEENLKEAIKRVKANKGVAGVDKMTIDKIDTYFEENKEEIIKSIINKKYKPQVVKRVYIPKTNGKLRPLGIPVVVDRVIQQAIAQKIIPIYENIFSDYSYGFRPNRNCHLAIEMEEIKNKYEIDIKFKVNRKNLMHKLSTYELWITFYLKPLIKSYSQSYPQFPQLVWII